MSGGGPAWIARSVRFVPIVQLSRRHFQVAPLFPWELMNKTVQAIPLRAVPGL
jgi:hypothetical protein